MIEDPNASAILTIDLDAIATNYALLRDIGRTKAPSGTPAPRCAAVVKADAYGLGVEAVARTLRAAGCQIFFVATLNEALELRAVLGDSEIHVLNGVMPGTAPTFFENNLIPVVNTLDQLGEWERHCTHLGRAMPMDIHADTGMNRLGLPIKDVETLGADKSRLAALDVRLVISHLVNAEEPDLMINRTQLGAFRRVRQILPVGRASLANSSGVFLGADFQFDLLRPGAALYGVNPRPDLPNPMAQPVNLQARILQVRDVDSPMTVGYGSTHKITKKGKIATIATGYADGYLRSMGSRSCAYVGDLPAPVVGRVSMDLITLDVTGIPERLVRPGHMVDLIGPHNPIDRLAGDAGTIGYEILTALGHRYRRSYVGGPTADERTI